MQYAYCSSQNCNHSQQYGEYGGRTKIKRVNMDEFCIKCGSKMIGECPSCKVYRQSMDANFCPKCGKSYK